MAVAASKSIADQLTTDDKRRLENIAKLFDIEFLPQQNGTVLLRVGPHPQEYLVSAEKAHVRLFTELCSKTVRWVYFHPKESAITSLLGQTDARLRRIAELYAKWMRDAGPDLDD